MPKKITRGGFQFGWLRAVAAARLRSDESAEFRRGGVVELSGRDWQPIVLPRKHGWVLNRFTMVYPFFSGFKLVLPTTLLKHVHFLRGALECAIKNDSKALVVGKWCMFQALSRMGQKFEQLFGEILGPWISRFVLMITYSTVDMLQLALVLGPWTSKLQVFCWQALCRLGGTAHGGDINIDLNLGTFVLQSMYETSG